MKTVKITIILFFSILSLSSYSQDKDAIANALESAPQLSAKCELLQFNKETQNGYSTIISSTVELAEKQWKQFMESSFSAEVKKSKGALVSESITIKDICDAPLTVSAFFTEDEDGCKMKVFYERSGSYIFDKENQKEHLGVTNHIKAFLKKLYVVTYEEVLVEQRKIQEDESKKLEKLQKEGEKISKDIQDEDSSREKAENDIIDAEAKIAELQAKIEGLKGKIQECSSNKAQLEETMTKKSQEIINQKGAVESSAARIEKIKSSSEKLN